MNSDRSDAPGEDATADSDSDTETATTDAGVESGSSTAGDRSGDTGASAGERRDRDDRGGRGGRSENDGRREVIVSREIYKITTVFSTLIAIGAVVGGFVLLDTATNRTVAAASEVNLPLAIAGVGSIALGAAVYAFATRFRTRGMGSPNSDADGNSENG